MQLKKSDKLDPDIQIVQYKQNGAPKGSACHSAKINGGRQDQE